jgi:hypothetical protein
LEEDVCARGDLEVEELKKAEIDLSDHLGHLVSVGADDYHIKTILTIHQRCTSANLRKSSSILRFIET